MATCGGNETLFLVVLAGRSTNHSARGHRVSTRPRMLHAFVVACHTMLALVAFVHAQDQGAETSSINPACFDTTAARPPDISCPPGTAAAAGIDGIIESSTIKSCSQLSGSDIDCGTGNATVIVYGLRPGQGNTITVSLNFVTQTAAPSLEDNQGLCSGSTASGRCVTITPVDLVISVTDSVLVYSMRDSNLETHYAYTAFHGMAATKADGSKDTTGCGRGSKQLTEETDRDYTKMCVSSKTFGSTGTNSDYYKTGDKAPVGQMPHSSTHYCTKDDDKDYVNSMKNINRFEHCAVPFPKPQTSGAILSPETDPGTGLRRLDRTRSYTSYRFPSPWERCTAGGDPQLCYSNDNPDVDRQAYQNQQWDFFDATIEPLTGSQVTGDGDDRDNRRCRAKYGTLSEKQTCRMWAGSYFTQMAVLGSEFHGMNETLQSNAQSESLLNWLAQSDPNKVQQLRRYGTFQPAGHQTYSTYVHEKRPVCPGCPGPYGPWRRWLLPRAANTDKPHASLTPNNHIGHYPAHDQCYEDDDECCDGDVFVTSPTTGNKLRNLVECASEQEGGSTCPMRTLTWDERGSDKPDDDQDKAFTRTTFLDMDLALPDLRHPSAAFAYVSDGVNSVTRSICESMLSDDNPAADKRVSPCLIYEQRVNQAFISLGIIGIIAFQAAAYSAFTFGISLAVGAVAVVLELLFLRGLKPLTPIPRLSSEGMGVLFPTCRVFDTQPQPSIYFGVNATLTFTDGSRDPETVSISNMETLSKDVNRGGASTANLDAGVQIEPTLSLQDTSPSRAFSMRIINIDTTSQKLGDNLDLSVVVCNATNNLIFEADDSDLSKNPWDRIERKRRGIYTPLPGPLFRDDPDMTSLHRTRQCKENPSDAEGDLCNQYAWWYTYNRAAFGRECGKLGIPADFFLQYGNQNSICQLPYQYCIPGLGQASNAEQVFSFEDRISDRINEASGNDTFGEERRLAGQMDIQTPCQITGQLMDIEDIERRDDVLLRLDPTRNRQNPLPPNWVEMENPASELAAEALSNPKYALHGTNLLYYGKNGVSDGTTYVRLEIVIAGNVLAVKETVSTGRFVTSLQDFRVEDPACGVVFDGTGTFTVEVENTGAERSSFRVTGSCDQPSFLVAVADLPTLDAGERVRVNVQVDSIGTPGATAADYFGSRAPRCTFQLTHPTYSDILFDEVRTNCEVIHASTVLPDVVPSGFEICAQQPADGCIQDLRLEGIGSPDSPNTGTQWVVYVMVVVLIVVVGIAALCLDSYVQNATERRKRAMRRIKDARAQETIRSQIDAAAGPAQRPQ